MASTTALGNVSTSCLTIRTVVPAHTSVLAARPVWQVSARSTVLTALNNCTGQCVNLLLDNSNCGSCANQCVSGQTCVAGQCTTNCAYGLNNCTGQCVNFLLDNSNCGSCAHECVSGQTCVAGQCTTNCPLWPQKLHWAVRQLPARQLELRLMRTPVLERSDLCGRPMHDQLRLWPQQLHRSVCQRPA